MRNLATSLILNGRIRTTDEKAKEVRPIVERMVTMAKKGGLHSRRLLASRLYNGDAVTRLFEDYAVRFKDRVGGYTRIIKEGNRPGDNAAVSIIEFLDADKAPKKATDKGASAPSKKKGFASGLAERLGLKKGEETAEE